MFGVVGINRNGERRQDVNAEAVFNVDNTTFEYSLGFGDLRINAFVSPPTGFSVLTQSVLREHYVHRHISFPQTSQQKGKMFID